MSRVPVPVSTVNLYGNAGCTGAVIGSGTTNTQGLWVIPVAVAPGATIDAYGTASVGMSTSICSTSHAQYTALVPPDTTITRHPRTTVKTSTLKAGVCPSPSGPP
jgi:hypothetical protein